MDKEDIVRIARRIDTFETSILPYEDCCTVFTPRHPKTKPQLGAVLRQLEANAPGRSNTMQLDFETVEAYNNPSVPSEVVDKLHSVDIETLTPLEALNFLYELKTVLDKE